jgi:hypothetical protein
MSDGGGSSDSLPTSSDGTEPAVGNRRIWVISVAGLGVLLAAGWLLGSSALFSGGGAELPQTADSAVVDEPRVENVKRIIDLGELPPGAAEHIEVAYFHRTQRCWSCTEAERLTRMALDHGFAEDLAAGRLSLAVADVEQPENADLAARYQAWGSSLYLGITKAGATYVYPVSDIWFTIRDEEAFVASLEEKIRVALGE